MTTASLPLILNKQPILNASSKVVAYHLSLDSVSKAPLSAEQWQDGIQSLNEEIEKAGGYSTIANDLPIYYSAPLDVLKLEFLPQIAFTELIVEVTADILRNKEALLHVKEMMAHGIRISIEHFTGSEPDKKLLSVAQIVKLPTDHFSLAEIKSIVAGLDESITVILTKVETEENFKSLADAGFRFFQGYYFTDPVIVAERPLEASRLSLLKLLAKLNDSDIPFNEVAELMQTDVILSHKLLSAINHPSNEVPYFVENLKDAVNFMGLKRLKFWANMMMLSQVDNVPQELLITALVRAKFLESLAELTGHQVDADRFFMVGLFSTLNAFMRVPMVDIVQKLPLTDEIKTALVDQQGSMGKALFIARAMEQGNTHLIMMGYEGLGIMEISSDYMKATGWAHQTMAALKG